MGKYDETRARQILESAADVLAPDLEARRIAARELIKERGGLAGTARIKTAPAGESKARLTIGEHGVTIRFDGMTWEVLPDGSAAVTVDLHFDPHDHKFTGDQLEGKDGRDGLAILLEAA